MKPDQSIAVLKALSDRSRLSIVASLLEAPGYVEELAQRHGLAPSTVSFHLAKLQKAGLVSSRKEQYYVVFRVNEEIFDTTLRAIVMAHPAGKEVQEGRMETYRSKVLDAFFRNGRLEKLPAQHKKRLIVLERFAVRFEPGRSYGEEEVTGLIIPLFDDYCTIRRLLVDERLIRREGDRYWREGQPEDSAGVVGQSTSMPEKQHDVHKGSVRSMIKRMYRQNRPDMGIYQIRNKVNGRIYVGSTTNMDGIRNSRNFQLRMGKVVFSRELQKDLNEFGAENFEFSVLEVLDTPSSGPEQERELAARYVSWLEKLQPFDERGYNSAKAYQRDVKRLGERNGE